MKVFVLAPIHNRKEITLKFLRSFANQTYPEYQMIIVDDGSIDGSSKAILSEFPRTIILNGDGNLWWTGAMRMGIEYILSVAQDEDFVLAINDDVTVKNEYIKKLVSASDKNKNAIVGSLYMDSQDGDKFYDCGVKIDWKRYKYFGVPYNQESKVVSDVDVLSTRGTLIPIKFIKRIGNFEKKLRHYAADYEYALRAKKNGYNLIVSYDAVVYGSEKEKINEIKNKTYSPSDIWERNFSLKSSSNIYNHLFIIWNYCPSFIYKIRHSLVLIVYNLFLFLKSIIIYPINRALGIKNDDLLDKNDI